MPMTRADWAWLLVYFSLAWTGHICQGLAIGILGPTQPYLASIVGVAKEQINFIWTGRGVGSCVATLLTGMVFKRFVRRKWQKLGFLAASVLSSGVFIGLVPFVSSFGSLLVGKACFTIIMNKMSLFPQHFWLLGFALPATTPRATPSWSSCWVRINPDLSYSLCTPLLLPGIC